MWPFEGVLSGLVQIVPGSRCIGRAVTVREITARRGDFTAHDFSGWQDHRCGWPSGCAGHRQRWAPRGGLATLAAKLKGAAGLVVDGGMRDLEEMVEHALPVFARHLTPLTGRSRLAVTGINEPVSCGGVRVRPGDVLVGEGSRARCRGGRVGSGIRPRR
jgi:regulator of RNase E activity RraA